MPTFDMKVMLRVCPDCASTAGFGVSDLAAEIPLYGEPEEMRG